MSRSIQTYRALSPAKVNLFLHINNRRSDGYHSLQTVFQLLDWGDDMEFELLDPSAGVILRTPMPGVSADDNLILRAAALLTEQLRHRHLQPSCGVAITVRKTIPMGGGLGGGSSNAGTTLRVLNKLWQSPLTEQQLIQLALQLGADVPVFAMGRSAWAEGIGEQLQPFDLPARWYVVLHPRCHVSTAEIFAAPELTRDTPAITMSAFFAGQIRNDLQPVVTVRYPAVKRALELLEASAPSMMTGSGACVFAAFDTEASAKAVASAMPCSVDTMVAKGINRSPPIIEVRN